MLTSSVTLRLYLDVSGGLGEGGEAPGSPSTWNPKLIYGIAAPGGPRFHMMNSPAPGRLVKNDGNAIRIQGIRTLWLRQRVLLKSPGGATEGASRPLYEE